MVIPLHPDCQPLEQLIRIGPRLGSLKIEHSKVVAYTGLLKKSYVFAKIPARHDPPPTGDNVTGGAPAAILAGAEVEDDDDDDEGSGAEPPCNIVRKASRELYPCSQSPTHCGEPDVFIRFKGISRLDETLKVNVATHIINQELEDTLAGNHKPKYLIEQRKLLLNQQG